MIGFMNIRSQESVQCVNCGHHNYPTTEPVTLTFADLNPSDVGLLVEVDGRGQGMLIGYSLRGESDKGTHHHSISLQDWTVDTMRESDSTRHFIYDAQAKIVVHRPQAGS